MNSLKKIVVVGLVACAGFVFGADTLGSWATSVRNGSWRTGKLSAIASTYESRMKANKADYSARILHAAAILAQLGEDANVQTFAKKFGYTVNYLGMNLTGKTAAASGWAKPNDIVDKIVSVAVPVAQKALADLEEIPENWQGTVLLSTDEYPVDEDVWVDIGDVLYARASLEALIGTAYFLKGYDLPVDWAKAVKVKSLVRSVPLLTAAPSLTSTTGWDKALKSKKDGKEMWLAFAGKKLYVRLASLEGEPVTMTRSQDSLELWFENDGANAWSEICLYQNGCDEDSLEWTARCWASSISIGSWPDYNSYMKGWDGEDWEDYDRRWERYMAAQEAYDKKTVVPHQMTENSDSIVIVFDLSAKSAVVKGAYWEPESTSLGQAVYGTHWVYDGYWDWDESGNEVWVSQRYEEEGWHSKRTSFSFDADGLAVQAMVTEQTGFAAKVRDASALSMSKTWVRRALTTALAADEAVQARSEYDNLMHFVEYDKLDAADADAIDKARRGTVQALAALDDVETVDASSYADRTSFDTTLLPNEGVFQVYLGALFAGKITRDLLPQVTVNEYGEWQPIAETIKDPTMAGLFLEFTVGTWKNVFSQYDIAMAHTPVTVKLDANGGKIGTAAYGLEYDEETESYYYGEIPSPNERVGYVFAGWFSDKTGGSEIVAGDDYSAALFAGQKTPTLYAHWVKAYTVTLKDESAYLYYYNETYNLEGEWQGKGVVSILEGSTVYVGVDSERETKTGYLEFQKWDLSPSSAVMGSSFRAGSCGTEFTMPAVNVTLQAAYANPDDCGYLCVYPMYYSPVLNEYSWYNPVELESYEDIYDEEYGYSYSQKRKIHPTEGSFQWSPDGGKTWYNTDEEEVMLKAGKYTVTFRSLDASWVAPKTKYSATVDKWGGTSLDVYDQFTFLYVVKPDILTIQNGEVVESAAGGSVTMNPKDGAMTGNSVTLTAKASKGYYFQGWTLSDGWQIGDDYWETSATYKLNNGPICYLDSNGNWVQCGSELQRYLNPEDAKVHVKAIFRHVSDYRAEDLVFRGFEGYDSYVEAKTDGKGNASVVVQACVGCALDDLELVCGPNSYPLTYKLTGKLPSGLKFDAKTGKLTGVPTKAENATFTISATDPAKNSANLTVAVKVRPLPSWVAGDFRALVSKYSYRAVEISEEEALSSGYAWFDGERYYDYQYAPEGIANGVVELSVGSTAKVSAKYINYAGTISYSGQLTWYPDEENEEADGTFAFYKEDKKGDIEMSLDGPGAADVWVDMSYKDGKYEQWISGRGAMTQFVKENYLASSFKEKYYTFAMQGIPGKSSEYDDYYNGDYYYDDEDYYDDGNSQPTGYGYLTLKTDKSGIAKVTGMLPDGEKVSTSAAVLVDESGVSAHVYVFAAPSSYKKHGQFAADLLITVDGQISLSGDVNGWRLPAASSYEDDKEWILDGLGGEYGSVKSLDGYYWRIFCAYSDSVGLEYSWKEQDGYESWTEYGVEYAKSFFGGAFFDVMLKGDAKGGISLVSKSPVPWKQTEMLIDDDGQRYTESWYNYVEDAKGNVITDPSQLSIAFTKATGIFSGKATVYFDYWQPNYKKDRYGDYYEAGSEQHKSAALPYNGVMVSDGKSLNGFGAAVYSAKYTVEDEYTGKRTSVTEKVSLPVTIDAE